MRRIITTMHVTIDGKTVRPDGSIDWVGEGPEAYDFEAFDRVDACVLGRVMYPEYEEYWRGRGGWCGRYAPRRSATPNSPTAHRITC